jgi:hypothetical protein
MNYKVLASITNKQKEIMDLVFRLRFINRHQIQRLLNHKDPKRINAWLKDLVDKGYLGRIYSHKLLENTKPAIYYLHNNGIVWARYEKEGNFGGNDGGVELKYIKKYYQDKNASITFVNHCVTLSEFYVQFKEHEYLVNKDRKKPKLEYYFETKSEMWITRQRELYGKDFNEVKQYIPDLYLERFKNPEGPNMDSTTYFIELFDPKVPRYAIKYKIQQFVKLKEDEKEWKNRYTGMDGVFPTILLVFPNQPKLNGLAKFINHEIIYSYANEGLYFMATTYQKAMAQTLLAGPKIWKILKGE